jgi:phosphoribosyl 1,2-cyclic phosphodiesterase
MSILLDNGFSSRELKRRMGDLSFNPDNLEFIFLSHIHSDHLKGVESLSCEKRVPVVLHENLHIDNYINRDLYRKLSVTPMKEYTYKSLKFTPFSLYHDAPSSLSYYFELGGVKITVITDTGIVDENMYKFALQSDILFLESNYSVSMLETGKYPQFLKNRISSDVGHLSNFQAADFMEKLQRDKSCRIKQIYLCHLSKNNNSVKQVDNDILTLYRGHIPYRICERDELVDGIRF